jgi:hypothetical protein
LHEVNEDFRTRHGIVTPSISGDVPRFWRELKKRHRTEELHRRSRAGRFRHRPHLRLSARLDAVFRAVSMIKSTPRRDILNAANAPGRI